MREVLIIADHFVYGDGTFAEVKAWKVPIPFPPTAYGFKYRLVYIVDRERVIGFDNERGKGDHQHVDDLERPYAFRGIDALMDDFATAIERWRAINDRR